MSGFGVSIGAMEDAITAHSGMMTSSLRACGRGQMAESLKLRSVMTARPKISFFWWEEGREGRREGGREGVIEDWKSIKVSLIAVTESLINDIDSHFRLLQ
jgi:hypothetical protein